MTQVNEDGIQKPTTDGHGFLTQRRQDAEFNHEIHETKLIAENVKNTKTGKT